MGQNACKRSSERERRNYAVKNKITVPDMTEANPLSINIEFSMGEPQPTILFLILEWSFLSASTGSYLIDVKSSQRRRVYI
jgi:hypothetical protein